MDTAHQVRVMRDELSNLRKQLRSLKEQHRKDVQNLKSLLFSKEGRRDSDIKSDMNNKLNISKNTDTNKIGIGSKRFDLLPIGFVSSPHEEKNGTPRQACVDTSSKGHLRLVSGYGSSGANLAYGLRNLSDFSHLWLIFIFDRNTNEQIKTTVKPPRAEGMKKGVFSTRSPHRPNPIGLSLVEIERVDEDLGIINFIGCDLVNGTPVVDIKPFIPIYDIPTNTRFAETTKIHSSSISKREDQGEVQVEGNMQSPLFSLTCSKTNENHPKTVRVPNWIASDSSKTLKVIFTPRAKQQLLSECGASKDNVDRTEMSLESVLRADPRSLYRRTQCSDRLYYFTLASLHVTVWFDDDDHVAEVLKVKRTCDSTDTEQS